jgi:hypothetical protein
MKNLLNEIKAMNKIAGTELTKKQEIAIIRERLEQLNEVDSFAKKMEKMNSGWNRKAVMKMIEKEYEKPEDWADTGFDVSADYEDHQEYLKGVKKWFDKMEKSKPTVKVGDIVKVKARSIGKEVYGRIKKEATMQGNFMFAGNVEPNKIPAWEIECYRDETMKQKLGTLQYPQHQEGESFRKA